MKKTSPRFRFVIAGRKAEVTRKALRRFVAIMSSNAAALVFANGAMMNAPALLMSTSTGPKCLPTARAIAATAFSLVTSHGKSSTSAPSFRHSRAVARRFGSLRSTSASRTPGSSAANTCAMAAPMPCEAPVMITTGPGSTMASAEQRTEVHEVGREAALHAFADHADGVVRVQRLQVRAGDAEIGDALVGVELLVEAAGAASSTNFR